MVIRSRSHEIDTMAQRMFNQVFPESWVIRRQDPDYGIDFQVEIFRDGKSLGVLFEVQLKGTSTAVYRDGFILLKFSVKHLVHYLRDRVLPTAILLADVKQNRIFWISVDKAVDNLFNNGSEWLDQDSVTLYIPEANELPGTIDQLAGIMSSKTNSLKDLNGDSGYLAFSIDDYCYVPDYMFKKLSDFKVEFDIKFLSSNVPREIIASFCNIGEGPKFPKYIGIFEIWRINYKGQCVLAVLDRSSGKSLMFIGPDIPLLKWIQIQIIVDCGNIHLFVDQSYKVHILNEPIKTGPVFLIGACFNNLGISSGLTGAIKKIGIFKVPGNEVISLWTFPRIDPGLDVSGNRRYLTFPLQETSRSTITTNHPLRVSVF